MNKVINHIKRWNVWRKHNKNGIAHKILVLFGVIKSPTFFTHGRQRKPKHFMMDLWRD